MPEYTYSSQPNPFVGSIGAAMLRRGDIAERRAAAIAEAESRAAIASGAAWGHAAENFGTIAGGVARALTDPRRQMDALALQRAQDLHAGEQRLDEITKPYVPNGPQEPLPAAPGNSISAAFGKTAVDTETPPPPAAAPAQHPYLDDQGLYDIPKLTQALSASGMTHLAPELLKGSEAINDAILKHQALQQKADEGKAIVNGDMAHGVLTLMDKGMPFDKAFDFTASPGFAATGATPQQYVQLKQQLAALPPDQQRAALTRLMDQAAQLSPEKDLADGAQRRDRYGRLTAENEKSDLAPATFGIPQPDGTVKNVEGTFNKKTGAYAYQGQVVPNAVKDVTPKNPLPLDQQLLEAIAKGDTVGKQRILDTMQAESTAKRDPTATAQLEELRKLTADEARARLDDRDPTSDKNQQKFEQEYRAVLQRTLSSRSGGLGMEDQKVNQAIHLLTLFDQQKDPKTGAYNIPKMMVPEVALGLARLISPTGQPAESTVKEIEQRTAAGDIAGVITYLTGEPVTGSTQAIFKTLRDSIERQGRVAEQNRASYFDSIRAFAPTDLSEPRRVQLERGLKLNTLPAATTSAAPPKLTPGLERLANRP